MKMIFLAVMSVMFASGLMNCGSQPVMNMVNEQRIAAEQFNRIELLYRSENMTLFSSHTEALVIKEFMTEDKSEYYAVISKTGNAVRVEGGDRPIGGNAGFLSSAFNVRVEVYIPDGKDVNIQTTSGGISVDQVNGNATMQTTSGSITVSGTGENTFAKATSGGIDLHVTGGNVKTKTASGGIQCTVAETIKDISLWASSGKITLNIPRNSSFNFTSQTSGGNLSTPFPEKLVSPLADEKLVWGTVGDKHSDSNINVRTSSGSIKVNWID